ncbi:MAG: hypothetical protein Q8S00_32335 [Deltaproteobacteria bacterium]|nr:hypothetical protein [Deltaproteobacteria bacterium]
MKKCYEVRNEEGLLEAAFPYTEQGFAAAQSYVNELRESNGIRDAVIVIAKLLPKDGDK